MGLKQEQGCGARNEGDVLLDFGLSQWQKTDVFKKSYIIYRALAFIILLLVRICQTTIYIPSFSDFLQLLLPISMWIYLATLLDASLQLATSILLARVFKSEDTALSSGSSEIYGRYETEHLSPSFARLVKLQLVVVSVSRTVAPLVTLSYLSGVLTEHGMNYGYFSKVHYIIPLVYAALDLLVSRMPCKARHFLFPASFLLTFTGYTWIYYCYDGRDIFGSSAVNSLIDWQHSLQSTIVAIAALVLSLIIHVVNMTIVRMRQKICAWKFQTGNNSYTLLPLYKI